MTELEKWYRINAEKIKKKYGKKNMQDAEEILHDTVVRLLKSSDTPWNDICRIRATEFAAFGYFNPHGRHKNLHTKILVPEEEANDVPDSINLETDLYNKKCIETISTLVNELSGASREIFKMHFFQEMGYGEIAKKLNMDHKSCKQLGSRAKKIIVEKFNILIGD